MEDKPSNSTLPKSVETSFNETWENNTQQGEVWNFIELETSLDVIS